VIREIDIYGLLVSPLLAAAVVALAITWCMHWLLERGGLYRWVWHATLFDLALFVIVLGLVALAAGNWWGTWHA
jgi:predicted PurR-regulated permease PerM